MDNLMRKKWTEIEEERIKEIFSYDKDSGFLIWMISSGSARMGSIAGSGDKDGYLRVQISFGKRKIHARVHRICWFLFYGSWPSRIDHVNGDKKDNRIINMREANGSQNMINRPTSKANTSGRKGVSYSSVRGAYVAYINHSGKRFSLGEFKDFNSACAAREAAENKFHGEFSYK